MNIYKTTGKLLLGVAIALATPIFITSCTSDDPSDNRYKGVIKEIELSPATRAVAESLEPAFVKYTTDVIKYALSHNESTTQLATSPLSATMLMALIANGIDDESRKEITDYLGTEDVEALNEFCKVMLTGLPKADPKVTIDMANSIWVNKYYGLTANQDYLSILDSYFKGESFNFNFQKENDKLLKQLKKWYSANTGGLIVNPESTLCFDGSYTLALLLNSLYFKAPWTIFPPENTKKAFFNGLKYQGMIETMTSRYVSDSPYYMDDDFEAFSLAFGGSAYSLHVVMPSPNLSIEEAVDRFTPEFVKTVDEDDVRCSISVSIPKFMIESELFLNRVFAESGVKSFMDGSNYTMFNSPLEGDDIEIRVWQTISFGISEKGVEVAAVSKEDLNEFTNYIKPGERYEIKVDRPFFFYITENSTKAWITSGFFGGPN